MFWFVVPFISDECEAFLIRQAQSLDLPVKVYHVHPKKPIVILTWVGTQPTKPSILLNSHMDVVPVFEVSSLIYRKDIVNIYNYCLYGINLLTLNINHIIDLGQMDLSTIRCTHGRAGQHLCSRQSGHEMRGNTILGGNPQIETEWATLSTHYTHVFRPGRRDRRCSRNERLCTHCWLQSFERRFRVGRRCGQSIRAFLLVLWRKIYLAHRDKMRGHYRSRIDYAGQYGWGKIESHNRSLHGF